MLNLKSYEIEMVAKPKMLNKIGKYKCGNSIKIDVGDFILTHKREVPIVIKEIANTLPCYSIKEEEGIYRWYRFPYLIDTTDTEQVRKLSIIQAVVKEYDAKKTDLYTKDSFMYFAKSQNTLSYTCYTKTEIPGIYIFTEVLNDTCAKKFVVLTNSDYASKVKKYFIHENKNLVAKYGDADKVSNIKPYIELL